MKFAYDSVENGQPTYKEIKIRESSDIALVNDKITNIASGDNDLFYDPDVLELSIDLYNSPSTTRFDKDLFETSTNVYKQVIINKCIPDVESITLFDGISTYKIV